MEQFDSITPLPAVDPADVQAVWQLMHEANAALGESYDEAAGTDASARAVGIDTSIVARVCSRGAEVQAVFFRTALIDLMLRMGLLNSWQQDAELGTAVYRVAATIPIASLNGFDPDSFLTMLRDISEPR